MALRQYGMENLLALACILAATSPINAQQATEVTCAPSDCVAIYRAALRWFSSQHGIAFDEIVVDTAETGQSFLRPRQRRVEISAINRLVSESGTGAGSQAEVLDCVDERLKQQVRKRDGTLATLARCRLRRGSALVGMFAPAMRDLEGDLLLSYRGPGPEPSFFFAIDYIVTVRRQGTSWIVLKTRIFSQS